MLQLKGISKKREKNRFFVITNHKLKCKMNDYNFGQKFI